MRMKLLSVILLLGLAACPGPAAAATEQADTAQAQLLLDDMRTFTDVFTLVRDNYVDEVGDRSLLDSALRGMVSSLDPHSEFLAPDEARAQDEQAQGRFGGIGIDVDIVDGRIFVIGVRPGGPAEQAGVQAGEMITAIDGRPVKGRPIYKSLDGLRGEPGTQVEVRFDARTIALTRAYIPITSVHAKLLEERYGYFRISHFHVNSGAEFRAALQSTTESAPDGLDGIVVDLRGNGGGVVGSAIVIADGFLDDGLVVFTRGRESTRKVEYFAEPGQWAPGVPLAVLIDGRTASASEILAGALQDHERAILVGERSYGKGTVQTVLTLRNGSALKLTTSRYFTPTGKSINVSGINPDVVAEAGGDAEGGDGPVDLPLQTALDLLADGEL